MKDRYRPTVVIFILTACISIRLTWAAELDLVLPTDPDEETATYEYCMLEIFQPRCLKNEVILMKSATYGRMRIGRCITAEEVDTFGSRFLGCSANVLPLLDRKCSGKAECNIRLSEISSERINPCVAGLTVYLEASYTCITIADEGRSCSVSVSTKPIHISTSLLSRRNCGTKAQPWNAVAPGGQNIKISLLQFADSTLGHTDKPREHPCISRGFIVDKAGKTNASICGGDEMPRDSELFLSAGNAVEIFINEPDQREPFTGQMILKLESVGCSDIIPPENAWLKRNEKAIVIGCYSSRQTWHLNCQGTKWIGVFGNCSQDGETNDVDEELQLVAVTWSDEHVLATVAICGFTLLICLSILCVGIVCFRRFSDQTKKLPEYNTLSCQSSSGRGLHVDHRMESLGITTVHNGGNEMQVCIPPEMPGFPVYIGRSDEHRPFDGRSNSRCVASPTEL